MEKVQAGASGNQGFERVSRKAKLQLACQGTTLELAKQYSKAAYVALEGRLSTYLKKSSLSARWIEISRGSAV